MIPIQLFEGETTYRHHTFLSIPREIAQHDRSN